MEFINTTTNELHKFNTHSQATRFLINYYVDQCGYKIFEPQLDNGVFAVANKEDGAILTLLDDKPIQKSTGYNRRAGIYTENDYQKAHAKYADIIGATSHDE